MHGAVLLPSTVFTSLKFPLPSSDHVYECNFVQNFVSVVIKVSRHMCAQTGTDSHNDCVAQLAGEVYHICM